MIYSFEQPLITVFITNLLLKKTESQYKFAPRPIRFIDKNSHNLLCVKSFIWNSSKWTTDIMSVYYYLCIKCIYTFNYNIHT